MGDIIYNFLPEKFALEDLDQCRLKVSLLQQLNDIFDCAPVIPQTDDDPSNLPPYLGYKRSPFALEKSYEKYGLLCFSETYRSPLLWGHYADSARGLALGFDPEHSLWKDPIRVIYHRSRPVLRVPTSNDLPPQFELDALRTCFQKKAKEWKYEKEVRYLVDLATCEPDLGHYFAPFPPRALREVIIGCRSPITPTRLGDILATHYKGLGVSLFTAENHPKLYKIKAKPCP